MSIVFDFQKFHDYIYGRKFLIYNDRLPLQSIFQKSLHKAPPRIQRFLLRLQKYDFAMHFIKGSLLTVAGTRSRASLKDCTPEISDEDLIFDNIYIYIYLISESRMKQFQEETLNDKTMQVLTRYIKSGWPLNRKHIPKEISSYYTYREELCMLDDLIMKGNQIVLPQLLRNEMKKLLHNGHLGVVKMKGHARETIFWPGLNRDIENITNCCEQCLRYQNKQKSERVIPHEIPLVPWTKVGTDLFCLKSKSYLIVVDYTSNFFDISQLPDKLSSTVMTHTKHIFSKFGIPKVVISDNGPEFKGEAYQKFSKTWDFQHLTLSPTYPKSNGQVERTIQLVKKTLTKAFCNNEDPYLALLSIRVNPGPYNNTAPATLFGNQPI